MKKTHFEKLIADIGRQVTLSDSERAHMRGVLTEYMAFKPYRVTPAPSRISLFMRPFAFLAQPAFATLVAVLVIAVSSGGAAVAAEGALPGDVLYPIKVSLTEPLRLALANTPATKIAVHQQLAERRIDEVAALANEGKLTKATEEELAFAFETHANLAEEATANADADASDTETDNVAHTSFTSRLAAYQEVLARVDTTQGAPVTETLQDAIRSRVPADTDQVALAAETAPRMVALFAVTAPTASTSKKQTAARVTSAAELQTATDEALHASADLIGSSKDTLDASSSKSARHELERAEAFAEKGRKLLEAHDEDGASEAFHSSLSTASRLQVLTRAAATLKINAFATTTATTSAKIETQTEIMDTLDSVSSEDTDDADEEHTFSPPSVTLPSTGILKK
ncbi:MAG TPA: DUF5667 domain-containing protein [Candidatus Paceibacterota bacterium]|nr:DUF5667 domain-containing protein [Candidatus Paceibacterota bacterium]